jgi:hypothetical protein
MTDERVHQIVCRWMRRVMHEKGWSANHWASLASTESTNITRVMNGERMIIPNLTTVAKLAAVAGSQPDLLRGGRKESGLTPVPVRRRAASPVQLRA